MKEWVSMLDWHRSNCYPQISISKGSFGPMRLKWAHNHSKQIDKNNGNDNYNLSFS